MKFIYFGKANNVKIKKYCEFSYLMYTLDKEYHGLYNEIFCNANKGC